MKIEISNRDSLCCYVGWCLAKAANSDDKQFLVSAIRVVMRCGYTYEEALDFIDKLRIHSIGFSIKMDEAIKNENNNNNKTTQES